MTATDEGFVKVQFNGTWLGQATQNTFWYGFGVGFAPDSFANATTIANEVLAELEDNPAGSPSLAAWRPLVPETYVLTGVDIWVKGVTGVELVVNPVALNIAGTRVIGGDALPPNITASAYAPAQRYGQRGSKLGFSGGTEPDLTATGWVNTALYFKSLVQTFCNVMYAGGTWLLADSATPLIPAVVPRIRSGTFGIYEYRLPIEVTDIPLTVSIAPWSVGTGTGTANSRKNPIR